MILFEIGKDIILFSLLEAIYKNTPITDMALSKF